MSDLLFFSVDPGPEFTNRLEQLLLAELESAPQSTVDGPAPSFVEVSSNRTQRRARRLVTVISVAAAVAALIVLALAPRGKGPDKSPDTTPVSTSSTTSPPSSTTSPAAGAVPAPRNGSALDAGTTYKVGRQAINHSFTFTNTIQDAVGNSWTGMWSVVEPRGGHERLYVGLVQESMMRGFNDPLSDVAAAVTVEEATSLMPEGPLAHFAELPGVTTEPLVATTMLGVPATAMRFSVGDVSTGHPCHAGMSDPCVLAFYVERSGSAIGYAQGESGTLYELTLDGTTYLFGVSDVPGVAELVASIRFLN